MVELSILGVIIVVFTIGLAVGVVVAVGMLFFIQVKLHFVKSTEFVWTNYFFIFTSTLDLYVRINSTLFSL